MTLKNTTPSLASVTSGREDASIFLAKTKPYQLALFKEALYQGDDELVQSLIQAMPAEWLSEPVPIRDRDPNALKMQTTAPSWWQYALSSPIHAKSFELLFDTISAHLEPYEQSDHILKIVIEGSSFILSQDPALSNKEHAEEKIMTILKKVQFPAVISLLYDQQLMLWAPPQVLQYVFDQKWLDPNDPKTSAAIFETIRSRTYEGNKEFNQTVYERAAIILKAGFDFKTATKDKMNITEYLGASGQPPVEWLKALTEAGLDLDIVQREVHTRYGKSKTLLGSMVEFDRYEQVKLLLEAGADPKKGALDEQGNWMSVLESKLHWKVALKTCFLLAQYGQDLNVKGENEDTLLKRNMSTITEDELDEFIKCGGKVRELFAHKEKSVPQLYAIVKDRIHKNQNLKDNKAFVGILKAYFEKECMSAIMASSPLKSGVTAAPEGSEASLEAYEKEQMKTDKGDTAVSVAPSAPARKRL